MFRKVAYILILVMLPLQLFAGGTLPRTVQGKIATALSQVVRTEVVGANISIVECRVIDDQTPKRVEVYASAELGYFPFREGNIAMFYNAVRQQLPAKYADFELRLYADGHAIESLVAGGYGDDAKFRYSPVVPLITRSTSLSQPTSGLAGRHIAMWQSHGYIWQQRLGCWQWQRPTFWTTVEDMYTQSYIVPYLLPMLERAGATVLLPRERSMRHEEVIIDNDQGVDISTYSERSRQHKWYDAGKGFAHLHYVYPSGHNPFEDGSTRGVEATDRPSRTSRAVYGGYIPVSGMYAVYVSYKSVERSVPDAHYTIHASGGDHEFSVNQRMGGGMWLCLGEFYFEAGNHKELVSVDNLSRYSGVVTTDAVKIGGGMGNVYRGDKEQLSDMPRFVEGARYWLQWSGFSEDVYTPNGGSDDYKDDYMSRARWVNDLMGGSERYSTAKGRNIPIDLAFALHSDAGLRSNDDIIGTLGIYSTRDDEGMFEGGASRTLSRELTDAVMSSVVNDIRLQYEPQWTRRGMWDRAYYEARIPKCPTLLLELLSHQNFADMRYGLDPAFRFDVSRAIYKGMLRYLATQYDMEYVVQPFPVKVFSAELYDKGVMLRWQPTEDIYEPTAVADYYILYTREGDGGFDTGRRIDGCSVYVEQQPGIIYGYKVTAVNSGGESLDSEVVVACRQRRGRGSVMIVNAFDRLSAPLNYRDSSSVGYHIDEDSGVGYMDDASFIGAQNDFDPNSEGAGTSSDNHASNIVRGNTFDYAYVHGEAIASAGYSFASTSRAAVEAGAIELSRYDLVDILMGKQCTTPIGRGVMGYRHEAFTDALRREIDKYVASGGALLISGSAMLRDLWHSPLASEEDRAWARERLGVEYGGSVKSGDVRSVARGVMRRESVVGVNTLLSEACYAVEQCDVLKVVRPGAESVMKYDNGSCAAVAWREEGSRGAILAFPIETIIDDVQREMLVHALLKYLLR